MINFPTPCIIHFRSWIPPTTEISYNKEPKSVTVFDLFTFFRADLIQSETS